MLLSKCNGSKKFRHKDKSCLDDKLCVIRKFEISVMTICMIYEIPKQIVTDIKKKRDDLTKFLFKFNVEKD